MKLPDADHPITITPATQRVRVIFNGQVIADSCRALALKEASYPVVHYIPRDDVNMALLTRSAHTSHCPYKGDAAYFSIETAERRGENAIWSYEIPFPAMSQIAGHLAFYPHRVDSIELLPLDSKAETAAC